MIYILHGQNGLAIEERVAALRRELDPSGFSTTVLDLQQVKFGEVQPALQSAPFFGGQRTVVLRGPAMLTRQSASKDEEGADDQPEREDTSRKPEWRDIALLLRSAPNTTTVICWIAGTLPANHPLLRAARDSEWKVEALRIPRGAELMNWVSERATANGVSIAPDAVGTLLDLLYPTAWRTEVKWETTTIDMRLIASEIEKLACAASDGQIDRALVEALVADRGGYTAFKLSDHLFGGQPEGAIAELGAMLEAGEPAEKILGQIAGDLAARWSVRATQDLPPDAVAAASRITPQRVTMLRGRTGMLDATNLATASELVRRAEWSVKTGRSRDTAAVIVPLVAELAVRLGPRREGRQR